MSYGYNKETINQGFLFLLMLFSAIPVFSQISGAVYSAKDSVALEGVSVYYDNTSIGTVTNSQGKFSLDRNGGTSPLVISFLGHEDLILQVESGRDLGAVYLKEKPEQLEEVHIESDNWSWDKKLRFFTREFLGRSPEAAMSSIKNPEVLVLRFIPSQNILTAYSKEPLRILNRYLGYEITYNLLSFKAGFVPGARDGFYITQNVSYEGTSFSQNLRANPRKKHLKNRKKSYLGSHLHFMRSLALQQLEENKFEIFYRGFKTDPYKYFKLEEKAGLTEVNLTTEQLSILYAGKEQSTFQTTSSFKIDKLGNHTPPLGVILGGVMAGRRIAHLLPLDYQP